MWSQRQTPSSSIAASETFGYQPGPTYSRGLLREARRQLMAVGESPKVAISSPAQYCGLRLRRGTRIRELPEEHEVLRRWCEETKPLLGSRAPRMEAERPKQRRWNGVDDPISHCLAGNSLLLTGLPGTGKTHLARTIVARLREQGEAVHLVSKTHCSAQNCWETSGSCRPCWTPGPGGPSARRWSTASSSATWPAGTGTSSRRTCAPTPASSTS